MSKYRVKFEVEFRVDINEGNLSVPGPPTLQGDSPIIAVRRAMWILFRQDLGTLDPAEFEKVQSNRRTFAVKVLVRGKWEDMEVVVEPEDVANE